MAGEIAILRRCRCCDRWLSIDAFVPLGKLCQECILDKRPSGRIARIRGIVLTPKGRAAIREFQAA